MNRLKQISIIFIWSLFFNVSLHAQASLLDQYAYTSPTDSILLSDYMDDEHNYLFILYGAWCDNCDKVLDEYLDFYNEWEDILKTKVVILNDFTFDDIEAGLSALDDYPYDALATERIRVDLDIFDFPSQFLYSANREQVFIKSGFTSGFEMNDLLATFLPKNIPPIFRGPIEQLISTYDDDCNEQETIRWSASEQTFEFNGLPYYKYRSSTGEQHYLRETMDGMQVYYLDTISLEAHQLYDFDVNICDTLSMYSVSEQRNIDAHVIDIYCVQEYLHIELDIPFVDCFNEAKNLTLVGGIGSNAGLLPKFNEMAVSSLLNCHKLNQQIVFEDIDFGDCQVIVSTEQATEKASLVISPNPATDRLIFNHSYHQIELISITDINGKETQINRIDDNQLNIKHFPVGLYVINYLADGNYGSLRFLKI